MDPEETAVPGCKEIPVSPPGEESWVFIGVHRAANCINDVPQFNSLSYSKGLFQTSQYPNDIKRYKMVV
jgi:hypothetical protein